MRIAIIGGSGFIGTRLATRLLASGHDVKILDKRKSEAFPDRWQHADVTDGPSLRGPLTGSEVIYNLAAEHQDNVRPRSLYYEVNVEGARVVCETASDLGIDTIVFTSSVAVYGFTEQETDETGSPNPFNDYGKSKLQAEAVYRNWQGAKPGRSLTIVRPTVVFGEENRGNIYNLFRQLHSRNFVMVGNGRNTKSIAYVENVAAFLEYALGFDQGQKTFNYVDKPDLDMNALVSLFRRETGRSPQIRFRLPFVIGYLGGLCFDLLSLVTRKKFPISATRVTKFCASSQFGSKHIGATGFKAPIGLDQGLSRTIRHEFAQV